MTPLSTRNGPAAKILLHRMKVRALKAKKKRKNAKIYHPIVPVSKPDGSVRICIDYRQLNNVTPQRRYYLPSLADIMDKAGNCAVMSTLDLTAGFHQIRMSPECEEMTTFGCPAGKFKFKRMPFGLKNAPAIFQAVVEEVLRPVSDVSVNYVDDVLVFTKTWEQHLVSVERVLRCLGEAGLTV